MIFIAHLVKYSGVGTNFSQDPLTLERKALSDYLKLGLMFGSSKGVLDLSTDVRENSLTAMSMLTSSIP